MTAVFSLRRIVLTTARTIAALLAFTPPIASAQANVPFAESFDTATTATFLTAGYRALPNDATKPMYFATGGGSNITITPEGRLRLTNGRFTIGNTDTSVTTTATVSPPGIFDLSQQYTVSFCVAAASGSGNFQIYVNNNTTGSANSPLGGASRIANLAVTGLTAGNVYSVTSTVGTSTAFLQLRSESAAVVVIDNLRIDYGASGSATCPAPGAAQLTLAPADTSWTTPVGGPDRVVAVTAVTAAGQPDTFTVASSQPSVVGVAVNANAVTLSALAAGTSTVTFTSGSDPTVQKTIAVTVLAPSTTVYDLNGVAQPAAAASGVHADTRLRLQFDAAPTLGSAGSVRIQRVSDGVVVDTIPLSGDVDALGYPGQDRVRVIGREAITIAGNTVTIAPHSHALAYDTEYRVHIDNGVITGATLNGTPFDGMGDNAGWRFTTRSAPTASANLVVDDDGPADFRTVQGAIDFAVQQFPGNDPVTVMIGNGDYRELLYLRGKNKLTLVGETRDGVVLHYRNSEAINAGTGTSRAPGPGAANGGRSVFLIENADLLTLENLTLRNTTLRSAAASQAETLYFNGDGTHRFIAKYARFQSEQDTLQLKSYAWIYRSLVEGNVDFIWGANRVSLFEESEIRSVGDTFNPNQGGYVLQARTVAASDKGFVFLNSLLTHGPGPGPLAGDVPPGTTYLARSGGSAAYFDNVVFINTRMDAHVATVGWAAAGVNGQPASNPAVPTATSGWREYGTTDLSGTPLNLSSRVGGYLLQPADVANEFSTRTQIFSAYGDGAGWDPLGDGSVDRLFASDFEATGSGAGTLSCAVANTVPGFASLGNGTTGGAGGRTATVTTGAQLVAELAAQVGNPQPLTIYIDGVITPANSGSVTKFDIKDMNNVSIIGRPGSLFDGIGMKIWRANNVIVRNVTMRYVDIGDKDQISLEGPATNIWIDHNELYNSLLVDQDFYDELVSGKGSIDNVTVSYNYLHDSWKTSLWGSSDTDNFNRRISFIGNRWDNVMSRLPLFRFGEGHVLNNYYHNVQRTAINSRMGAKIRVDSSHFEDSTNVVVSQDSSQIGFWDTNGDNVFQNVTWTPLPEPNCTSNPCAWGNTPGTVQNGGQIASTVSYVPPYAYTTVPGAEVRAHVIANAGTGKINACLGFGG